MNDAAESATHASSESTYRVGFFRDGERQPIDLAIEAGDADLDDVSHDVQFTTPLKVTGHAYRDGDEVMISARVSAAVAMSCGRCVIDMADTVAADMHVMYRPEDQRPDYLEGEEEVGLGYYEGGIIDIREDVRRYLLLEIPVWPVCDEDCKGLCATCGANLNDYPCDCAPIDDEKPRTPLAQELDRLFDS